MLNFKIIIGFFALGLAVILFLIIIRPKEKPFEENSPASQIQVNISAFKQQTNESLPNQKQQAQKVTQLEIKDDKVGEGEEAVAGKKVTVHYAGFFLDGKKFDSSIDRGEPFTFTLGAGEVIKGWDQGIAGMKVGGRRQILIPADLAYGERGVGNAIPPNTPLIFGVELLKVE